MFRCRNEIGEQLLSQFNAIGTTVTHPLDRCGHVNQPAVTFEFAYVEGHVSHAKPRVTTSLHVRVRSSPVLDQEERQAFLGRAEFGILGIERRQHVVGRNTVVERVNEMREELVTTNAFVER